MDSELLAALRALQARIESLEKQVKLLGSSVDSALRQRGLVPGRHSSLDRLLLPSPTSPALIDRFYGDLRRYHFRRLLQEAAELRVLTPTVVRRLEERWGRRALTDTFERLLDYGLLRRRARGYRAAFPPTHTFGDTLEWFIAQVFTREFAAPSAWDVKIKDIEQGGDFDVLAVLDRRLGYVECKGSPPYNVSADAIAQFLGRARRLGPDFSVFLLDTTLKIERNVIDNLRGLLGERAEIARVSTGVFEVRGMERPLFVVTSHRSLVANLRLCLRRLHGASVG